jgi:isoquinoline 1-oxidoreductase beta subunit
VIELNTEEIVLELENATLNAEAVAQNVGDFDKAMASAVNKIEEIYQGPISSTDC